MRVYSSSISFDIVVWCGASYNFLYPISHHDQALLDAQAALYLPHWLIDSFTMFNSYQTIPTLVVFALPSTMPHTIMSLPCRTQCSYIIISTFQNFDRISKFCQNFTILTELHNLDRISQFQQNFTILTEVHNYNRISQFWQNFTILSRFHNFE